MYESCTQYDSCAEEFDGLEGGCEFFGIGETTEEDGEEGAQEGEGHDDENRRYVEGLVVDAGELARAGSFAWVGVGVGFGFGRFRR